MRALTPRLIAVEHRSSPIAADALIDSVAQIAVDYALMPCVEFDQGEWGARRAPVGLAAWDTWVIEWERLPWTREWALL